MAMKHRWSNEFDPTGGHRWSNEFDLTVGPNSFGQQACHQKECVSSKLMCYPLNQGKILINIYSECFGYLLSVSAAAKVRVALLQFNDSLEKFG